MFETDTTKSHVETRPEEVIDIHNSINRAMVAPPGRSTEPGQAYIASVYKDGAYEVYIFLHLTNSNEGILYSWDEGAAPAEQIPGIYRSALEFTESMGFMMDDLKYREKTPEQKAETFHEVPMFHADLSRFEEAEEEDESELLIESLDEEGEDEEAVDLDLLGDEEDVTPEERESEAGPQSEEVSEIDLDDSEIMLVGSGEDEKEESASDSGGDSEGEEGLDEQALLDALEDEGSSVVEAEEVEEISLEPPADEQTQEAPPPMESMVEDESAAAHSGEGGENELLTTEEESILGALEEGGTAEEAAESRAEEEDDEIAIDFEEEEPEVEAPPSMEAPAEPASAEEEVEEISLEPESVPSFEPEAAAAPQPEPEPEPAAPVEGPQQSYQPAPPAGEVQPAVQQAPPVNVKPEDKDKETLVRFLAMM